ncbi:L2 protein [Phocoena phocoena papillomavirus 2]|uniref:Minor capsid protein L2 n=1 Tax=Phocoena phocoena papillomavirus 2 TaxID=706526 RepID=F2VIR6_9PAPI|nr:L2 protein [Phocoena phocoena papillomavirus 2]ADJ96351.1 L2 protein [Phocoena phocoena papillomavirus 2]
MRARRRRAAPDTLYRQCATGDCPIDVKNKFEDNTVADRILKWLSSVFYFGGLGISSGRGGAGRLPMGGTVTRPTGGVIDTLGPLDVRPPIDSSSIIDAEAPSVIPVSEGTNLSTEVPVIDTPGIEVHPPAVPSDPSVAIIDPTDIENVIPRTRGDTFAFTDGSSSLPTRVLTTHATVHPNPSYEGSVLSTGSTVFLGEGTQSHNVLVFSNLSGHSIGGTFEEIELGDLTSQFDIEEPSTSTPKSPLHGVTSGIRRGLTRARAQLRWPSRLRPTPINIPDKSFLLQPEKFIQFTYDNPTFQDTSLHFDRPTTVQAAPDPHFQDIVYLSKPEYSLVEGRVRVNRYGKTGTLKLRSGTQLGANTHYYTDLSSIHAEEGIEMTALGSHIHDSTLLNAQASGISLDSTESAFSLIGPTEHLRAYEEATHFNSVYSDSSLLDSFEDDFSHAQLIIGTGLRRPNAVSLPSIPRPFRFFAENTGSLYIHYPTANNTEPMDTGSIPFSVVTTIEKPTVTFDALDIGGGFYLHPYIRRKKRKRMYL